MRSIWPGIARGALAGFLAAGYGSQAAPPERPSGRDQPPVQAVENGGVREQLLAGVVVILGAIDRYDEARAAEQVFDRLVQWSHTGSQPAAGIPESLLESLQPGLRRAAAGICDRDAFDAVGDVVALRDRIWLAAAARTARGEAVDDLAVAERLFRWTVRSLAAVSDPPMVPTESQPGARWFLPGEIMLAGRASGPQRAWIFIELLRQVGLDGVMLATPGAGEGPPRPWLPAVLVGGEAYLFEPGYGMPVPGPGGVGIATLRQAAADPAILEALSLPERPYPVTASDLREVGVLAVADPWTSTARMARLDRELWLRHGVRVAVDVVAVLDRAVAALPEPAAGFRGLWPFPWETVARRPQAVQALAAEINPLGTPLPRPDRAAGDTPFRPLFAGRVREFRGEFDGPNGAKAAYLAARPSRRLVSEAVAQLPQPQAEAVTRGLIRMKEDATYWLGIVMLVEGQFAAAEDYLRRMTLEAAPDSRWTDAARVNLAAALVGLGRDVEAAAVLREDGSPQRFGSRLEANRLVPPVPASPP